MSTKIDYVHETINPLGWGCYGPGGTAEKPNVCPYCYAKRISQRKLRDCDLCRRFVPHAHFEQLEWLQAWKMPKTIFVQSMGDLFGDWVCDDRMMTVLNACKAASQHKYLFLTKNPKRYEQLDYYMPPNMWFGWSQTKPLGPGPLFSTHHSMQTFVSLEPLLEPFKEFHIRGIGWCIVGQETGNRKGRITPEPEWISNIVDASRNAGVPVFLKNNLIPVMGEEYVEDNQQLPWEVLG